DVADGSRIPILVLRCAGCRRRSGTHLSTHPPVADRGTRPSLCKRSRQRGRRRAHHDATAYCCLPELRLCRPADDNLTRLNRFTCVTARPSLCLRLAHVVTSISPRLDSRWGGYPLAGAGFSPAGSAKLRLAHRRWR